MKNVSNFILGLVVIGAVFVGSDLSPRKDKTLNIGSVDQAGEYQSTFVSTGYTDLTVIKNGAGTLGSVVLTGAAAGVLNLYDATSTVNNAQWATTTLASFPISAGTGTYTFDVIFQKGLLIDYVGVVSTSTITWR